MGKLQRDSRRVDTAEQQTETVRFRSTKLQSCLNAQQRQVCYAKIRDLVLKTWEREIWMRMVDIPKGADSWTIPLDSQFAKVVQFLLVNTSTFLC